jgi:hypothetical protein
MAKLLAKGVIKIDEGDKVTIRATVTRVWANGEFTVQFKTAGQKVTFTNTGDVEDVAKPEPAARPKRKGERLL